MDVSIEGDIDIRPALLDALKIPANPIYERTEVYTPVTVEDIHALAKSMGCRVQILDAQETGGGEYECTLRLVRVEGLNGR